jgi:uncharacterized protein (TIGR02118 family)
MVSYFVRYRGAASDAEAFRAYYEQQHAPLLRRFPGIRSLVLHYPAEAGDPCLVRHGGTFLLTQMQFENASALKAALHSPARQHARDDFQRFPVFRGEVTHEAMIAKLMF